MKRLFILSLAALLLAACMPIQAPTPAPDSTPPAIPTDPDASSLEGVEWSLVSVVGPEGNLLPAVEASPATISFQNGEVGGTSGCNSYGGTYSVDGNEITIGSTVATLMACAEEIMAQETDFFAALGQAASYAIVDGQLELYNADGETVATFATSPTAELPTPESPTPEASPISALEGVEWTLASLTNADGTTSLPVAESAATITFASGEVTGSTGCNTYRGSYTLDGDQLTFTPLVSTRRACEGEVMAQESAFLAALETVTSYTVANGQLELLNDAGETVAIFITQAVAGQPAPEQSAEQPVADALAWDVLASLNYQLPPGDDYSGAAPTGAYATGEIGGAPAAAVLLSASLEDRAVYALALVTVADGAAANVATEPLGEGVRINTLHIQDEAVILDFVSPNSDEAPCCGTLRAQAVYVLTGDQLSPAAVERIGEQSPVDMTQIIDYLPEIVPTETQAGSCFSNAIGLGRADAWRCMVGNAIHDPCFQIDDAPTLVCGADPATGATGFVLELTEPLPAADPGSVQKPWQIELEDGTLCGLGTGTVVGTADRIAPYMCTDGTTLFDDFDTSQPVVTVDRATFGVGENGYYVIDSAPNAVRTLWQ